MCERKKTRELEPNDEKRKVVYDETKSLLSAREIDRDKKVLKRSKYV